MSHEDLEFDPKKQQINITKHDGIDFEEANSALDDPYAYTKLDYGDYGEERYYTIGLSYFGTLLVVHWTIRDDNVRIFSAHKAEPQQRRDYENRKRQPRTRQD